MWEEGERMPGSYSQCLHQPHRDPEYTQDMNSRGQWPWRWLWHHNLSADQKDGQETMVKRQLFPMNHTLHGDPAQTQWRV